MIDSFRGKYRFLSNFWPSVVELDGLEYPTVEHAYQAAKTTDHDVRMKIRYAATPGDAKRAGQKAQLRSDWEEVKLGIMENLLRQKFSHAHLRYKLLDTKYDELVEGNTWGDTFWGVCKGHGQNHLGQLLMKIREEYRE